MERNSSHEEVLGCVAHKGFNNTLKLSQHCRMIKVPFANPRHVPGGRSKQPTGPAEFLKTLQFRKACYFDLVVHSSTFIFFQLSTEMLPLAIPVLLLTDHTCINVSRYRNRISCPCSTRSQASYRCLEYHVHISTCIETVTELR